MQPTPSLQPREVAIFAPASRFVRDIALVLLPSLVSRFMSVAVRARTAATGKASGSDSEAPPSFFARGGPTTDQDTGKPVSIFLTPGTTAAQPPPRGSRRSLRARFRSRFFARIFKPR